jgi:Rrf2 family protein
MKISSKGEYGVLALVDLATQRESGPVNIQSIADRQDIPKKYLEQVLLALKRGGFVDSTRGKKGGYYLAREPEAISLINVLDELEEQFVLADSGRQRPGYLESFWDEKSDEVREVLDVPLAEIVDRRTEDSGVVYHI